MKKRLIKLIALILIVLIPFPVFSLIVNLTEDSYAKTYLGAFEEKYFRLYNSENKKVIFIGGSSLPFGLRSDLIAEELGGEYDVINFGLYATLGTKFMMDMAKDAISEGDIVVLSPELNTQTYSLYFNPEAVLQATGETPSLRLKLPWENWLSVAYSSPSYAIERLKYTVNKNAPDPDGIYRADSINEWGDLSVARPNNIMNDGCDSNMLIYTDDSLLDEEFFAYVNDYVADAEEQGATVYFNYSPVNRLALRSSKVARAEFESKLKEKLDCELLGTIEDYMIDERYFYDTNFHLNSDGAVYFSHLLATSLKEELGIERESTLQVPPPPPLATNEVVDVLEGEDKVAFEDYLGQPNNDYLDVFEYAKKGNSYKIVGVKEEYRDMSEVILPAVYDGKNITAVEENAFEGCTKLEYVHVGITYKSLAAGSFAGCSSLKGVYLYDLEGKLSPPNEGLLNGTPNGVKIYIPASAMGTYTSGYTWSNYMEYFEPFDKGEVE